MVITSIQVVVRDAGTKLVGTANIILDNMVVIKEIKILCNDGEYFLAMPSRTTKSGTHKDMVHPINGIVRTLFETAILYAFKKAKELGHNRITMEIKNNTIEATQEFKPEEYEINCSTVAPAFYNDSVDGRRTDSTDLQSLTAERAKRQLQKNRVIDRMIHSCVLVYKGNTNYCSLEEYDGDLILDDEIINRATTEIERIIAKNGFVPNSDIVSIFKKCGVTNLQYYADSLSDFIDKYFTVFLVKRKAYIDGEEYPSVIIRREDEKNFYYFCEDNHVILDEFFNTSDYVGFIRSPFYLKYRPTELPMGWLEKALTCAKRILTNDDTAEVNLNSFQKELIVSYSGLDFIKHNKRGGQYKVELIKECSDTFLPKRKKNQRGTVVQALNDIGGLAGGTLNYEYKGLMQRTEACWNELYPPFSLIYVLHNPGRSIDCIQEMCNKLKRSNELDLIQDDRGRWLYLPQIIEVLYKLGNLNTLPVITQTLMFATFLDFDALEEIAPISHFFSDKRLWFMLNLLDDYKKMNECDYKEAFSININRELFQKICVRLWKKWVIRRQYP